MSYTIRPVDDSTWDSLAELVERNNGIFGGCWCIGYHPERGHKGIGHRAVRASHERRWRARSIRSPMLAAASSRPSPR